MAADRAGALWLLTIAGDTLFRFDQASHQFTAFPYDPADSRGPGSRDLRSVFVDGAGQVWVGAPGYLGRLDPASGSFTHYRHDTASASSLGAATAATRSGRAARAASPASRPPAGRCAPST